MEEAKHGPQGDTFLSRQDTKVIKGIAIILMLCHHLWAFPARLPGGSLRYLFTAFDHNMPMYLGMFAKVCVSLFYFLGGYGTYLSCRGKRFDLVGKLKRLYLSYWKVFLIFIPIAFLFFSRQEACCEQADLCARFASFNWRECLSNFFGATDSYNSEWWFLFSYAVALFTFPFIRAVIERNTAGVNVFIVVMVSILICNVSGALGNVEALGRLNSNYFYVTLFRQNAPFAAAFWMGVVVAKDGLLDWLRDGLEKNRLLNPVTDVLAWLAVIFLRQTAIGNESVDVFFVPVLIVTAMDLLKRTKYAQKLLSALGRQSTNMWLIHTFFCYYFCAVAKLVVAPRWAVPSLALLIALTYLASLGVTYLWKGVALVIKKGK